MFDANARHLPDGTGFISEEWKQKALDFLGGEWL